MLHYIRRLCTGRLSMLCGPCSKRTLELLRRRTTTVWSALHLAMYHGASEGVLEALLGAHPGAAWERNLDGRVALHFAMECGVSERVVQALLKVYPAAIKERDRDGRLPLHLEPVY